MNERAVGRINRVFEAAEQDGRDFLLEPEVYSVLGEAGIAVPRYVFLRPGHKVRRRDLEGLGSEDVVVKVVSPLIIHKSDVGGVEIVQNRVSAVDAAVRRMSAEIPGRSVRWRRRRAGQGGADGLSASTVRLSIRGFIVMEKVEYEPVGYGTEVLVGIRNTREFGPVLTVGGGGTDVEYMNGHLRERSASSTSSVLLTPKTGTLTGLEGLAFFGKVAAPFRGRKALVSPASFLRTLGKFRDWAAALSPFSPASPFTVEEAEVNPFVAAGGALVPLDGVCRFSRDKVSGQARPFAEIGRLLKPESIGIIGVSEKMNIGHIILNNVLDNGFPRENVFVVKPGRGEIEGCLCAPSIGELPRPVDLFVLTLGADQCLAAMEELVGKKKARSVIIIAGGMGEKEGGAGIEEEIRDLLARRRRAGQSAPVVNGGNCLGIASKPGRYDTTFIPEVKLPRPRGPESGLAVISQSGAFMICRTSKLPRIEPRYSISLGNQLDLTVSDYLNYLKDDREVRIFAVYMEGFRAQDGLAFARAVSEITAGGDRAVIVYKAGRSAEGRAATSSHTASVAGDYSVFRSVLERAGAVVARDILEFESFLKGLVLLKDKRVRGGRVGLVSNAGFECVILADGLENGSGLELAPFSAETKEKIASILKPLGIDRLQDIHNPLDVTPVADDAVFAECALAVVEDPNVDCAVVSNVPMTPAQQTLSPGPGHREDLARPGAFASRIVEVFRGVDKPLVLNIDSGELYDPLVRHLENFGIPVFRRADEAIRFLRSYVGAFLRET